MCSGQKFITKLTKIQTVFLNLNVFIFQKAFPLDSTLDSLTEFFEEFGEVESLSMRKDVKKKFKVKIYFRDFIPNKY
jgi:hypothetical protein